MAKYVTITEYKGKPQCSFHSTENHDDVISFREQAVSFGPAKANHILRAFAENGVEPVIAALLECAAEYEPTDRVAKANPALTTEQIAVLEGFGDVAEVGGDDVAA